MESPAAEYYYRDVPLPFQTSGELFQEIPVAEARRISGLFSERLYPREAVLFYEGGESDSLFILKNGLVKIVSLSAKGTETILHILRKDELFGELLLIEGKRPFTAVAITDVRVDVLSRKDLQELLASSPRFSANYARLLTRRLIKMEKEFSGLMHAFAYHRLAKELLHLSEDLGMETASGTEIALRLTHEDLANLIGSTRETVTIQLHKFEELGLILRKGRSLVVNRPRLREYVRVKET
jgi:CRP-like cAMP-binding protein